MLAISPSFELIQLHFVVVPYVMYICLYIKQYLEKYSGDILFIALYTSVIIVLSLSIKREEHPANLVEIYNHFQFFYIET